jgi:hypothetical protein
MNISLLLLLAMLITLINVSLLILSLCRMIRKNNEEFEKARTDIRSPRSIFSFGTHIDVALQNANSNLNFSKTVQWNYIYYVVLLFAGLFGIESQFGQDTIVSIVNTLAANAILHIGIYLLIDITFQIRRERFSLFNLQLRIARKEKNRNEISDIEKRENSSEKLFSSPWISLTLILTILFGYTICMTIIILKSNI